MVNSLPMSLVGDRALTAREFLDECVAFKRDHAPQSRFLRGLVTGKLDRKEWGVSWSKVTDVGAVVGDEVKLDIQAEITKEQPKK